MLRPEDVTIERLMAVDAGVWAVKHKILLDGRPFGFDKHEYQIDPMCCDAPAQCARKGAQIGWTSIKMLKTVHGLIHSRYPQGVLYLFPMKGDVTDFSKARFSPLINDNPIIKAYVQDTDAVNIKRVGKAMLYFRGAKSTKKIGGTKASSSALKSIPVDRIVFDEVDEMEPQMVELAEERVSHSDLKEFDWIGTPTIPDYGIDVKWNSSDQRIREIRCRHCGRYTCMEREFEEHGWENQKVLRRVNGIVLRLCKYCGREIYPVDGIWTTTYKNRDLVGWWISQLHSMLVDPTLILETFENPKRNIVETYNSKLGMPYIEAHNRLSLEEIYALCSTYGIEDYCQRPCTMGVDQGKGLHVVITRPEGTRPRIVHLGEYKDWEELDGLMRGFRVARCVVDAMPETRNARAFADRFPGKVWMNYYVSTQKGRAIEDESAYTVRVNRTESLDWSHHQIKNGEIALPRQCGPVDDFAKHCHNVAKRLEEDELTGAKQYIYVKLGPDHYRHAFNYECIARQLMGDMTYNLDDCFRPRGG